MKKSQMVAIVAGFVLIGCSGDPKTPAKSCVPGLVQECPCSGGADGTQTCNEDGTFDACMCAVDMGVPDVAVAGDMSVRDVATSDASVSDMAVDVGADTAADMPADVGRDMGSDVGVVTTDMASDMATMDMSPTTSLPTCSDANPPARCSSTPANFAWRPASIIDFIFMEGTDSEPICCFDYNGDGDIDNSLGTNLAGFGFLSDINSKLMTDTSNGVQPIVLEYDPLTNLVNDSFQLNWWRGAWGPSMTSIGAANDVRISTSSADQGAFPLHYLATGTLANAVVVATDGTVEVPLELFGAPLLVTVRRSRLEADIDLAGSNLPTPGVSLTGGKLGGVVEVSELFTAVNTYGATCPCLGLGATPLVDVQTGSCSQNANAQACETIGQTQCAEVAGACNLYGAIGLFADVDLNGDGLNDGVSVGFSFTAAPADIIGVVP